MTAATPELPRLAVLFDPTVGVMELREAAAGRWRNVWLVDRAKHQLDDHLPSLRRLGDVVDVTGLNQVESIAALATVEPRGVIAFSDVGVPIAAALARGLGLPSYSSETTKRLANKSTQRDALRAAGVVVPQFRSISSGSDEVELARISRTLSYPVIIKPQEGAGSRDTYRATDASEFMNAMNRRLRRDSDLIIEGQLEDAWRRSEHPYADFVSVESVIAQGRVSHIAVTGRATLAEPFRETGNFVPSNLAAQDIKAIISTAEQAVRAMEATTGVFHTEVKLTPSGPRVIEVNGRIGGGGVHRLLNTASGKSMLAIAASTAMGESVHIDGPLPCARVGYSMLVVPPIGSTRLTRLDRLEELSNIPGIENVSVERRVGDEVDWRAGFEGRILTIYGASDDHAQMWETRQRVRDALEIEFDGSPRG
jgi:biotin carboxylase